MNKLDLEMFLMNKGMTQRKAKKFVADFQIWLDQKNKRVNNTTKSLSFKPPKVKMNMKALADYFNDKI